MKNACRLGPVFAVLAFAAAPSVLACCTPCQGFCGPGVPRDTPCCTGIPQPGNACGLTTCGKWLRGQAADPAALAGFDAAVPAMTPAAAPATECRAADSWLSAPAR